MKQQCFKKASPIYKAKKNHVILLLKDKKSTKKFGF